MDTMLARHFTVPRQSYQRPCPGTGLFVDAEPAGPGSDHRHGVCPVCEQSIVLTTLVPDVSRGGIWEKL